MSVLITVMEMPHDCEECKLCVIIPVGDYEILRKCVALNKRAEYIIRRKDCPLVPVPPHGRLIDADALHEELYALEYARENEWRDGMREARGVDAARVALLDAPTIIEAEEAGQ